MGRQQKLKQARRLQRLNTAVMALIFANPVMTAKLKEINELKMQQTVDQEALKKKILELSNMIEQAARQQEGQHAI